MAFCRGDSCELVGKTPHMGKKYGFLRENLGADQVSVFGGYLNIDNNIVNCTIYRSYLRPVRGDVFF